MYTVTVLVTAVMLTSPRVLISVVCSVVTLVAVLVL